MRTLLAASSWVALVQLLCSSGQAEDRKDILYARVTEVSLTLDAHIPEGPGPFPAAIVVHGGGWVAGDKQQYITCLFKPLADAGFAWFSINYRLAPKYRFPAPAEDVERAIAYVKQHAAEFKINPERIALVGESAEATWSRTSVLAIVVNPG